MFSAVAHKNLPDAESYFDEHLAQNDWPAREIRCRSMTTTLASRTGSIG
jgi:hypothetical protein